MQGWLIKTCYNKQNLCYNVWLCEQSSRIKWSIVNLLFDLINLWLKVSLSGPPNIKFHVIEICFYILAMWYLDYFWASWLVKKEVGWEEEWTRTWHLCTYSLQIYYRFVNLIFPPRIALSTLAQSNCEWGSTFWDHNISSSLTGLLLSFLILSIFWRKMQNSCWCCICDTEKNAGSGERQK